MVSLPPYTKIIQMTTELFLIMLNSGLKKYIIYMRDYSWVIDAYKPKISFQGDVYDIADNHTINLRQGLFSNHLIYAMKGILVLSPTDSCVTKLKSRLSSSGF